MDSASFSGFVKLEIVGVDEPFRKGSQDTFTLSVEAQVPESRPEIYFNQEFGHISYNGEGFNRLYGVYKVNETDENTVAAWVYVMRSGDLGDITTVYFDVINPVEIPSSDITVDPYTFAVGEDEALIPIKVNRESVGTVEDAYADIYILENSGYTIGTYEHFELYINPPLN